MSDQTQQAVQTEAANVPEFIITKTGVMIVGSELIGDKLTALLCEAIAMNEGCGLSTVVLRKDDYPREAGEPVFGMAFADTHSFAINLQHCWDRAIEVAQAGKKNLSLLGVLWVNVLHSIGHELDHVDMGSGDRDLWEQMRATEEGNKDLEEAADETAEKLIVKLCLAFDTEIPAVSEMGWLGLKWMELHTDEGTKDLDWVVKARKMAEEGLIYEESDDIKITSFREFIKQSYDLKAKEDWDQAITAVNLDAVLEGGEVIEYKADPVEVPMVEAVELDGDTPAEAVEVAGEVMAATAAFVGAGTAVGEDALVADDMAVPLPAPVAAVAQQVATAATTATPPAPYSEPTYAQQCTLAPEQMPDVMKAVWQAIYHHIFTKCGWSQNPTTGRFFFANAAAVLEGVNIQHIITQYGADNFIMEYDTLNAEGQPAPEMCQGMIRGKLTNQVGLPSYTIYLNINGQRIKRTLLPQNPEKVVNNAYTKSADDAGAGNMIAWVFKGEAADSAPFKEKCAVKIRNNEYEVF